ncbi:hypothetical protein, partial [Vibrio diabolicus]|uniref:hypothetical protein n=1 Tax=Vibrio diabolicus TaxID=50719 RepID=UPI00211B13BA
NNFFCLRKRGDFTSARTLIIPYATGDKSCPVVAVALLRGADAGMVDPGTARRLGFSYEYGGRGKVSILSINKEWRRGRV